MPFEPLAPGGPPDPQPADVRIVVERRSDAVVLRVAGELDMLTTPTLENAIRDTLGDRPATMVIDLTEVTFLASPAMTAIVLAHQSGGEHTAVRVVSSARSTTRPLELTGLTGYLSVHPTLEAALDA